MTAYSCEDSKTITDRIKELRSEQGIPTCSCPKDNKGRRKGLDAYCKVHGDK